MLEPAKASGRVSRRRGRNEGPPKDIRVRPWSFYVSRLRRSRLRAEFHDRVIRAVAPEFTGGWLVDVGCGPGLLEARLAPRLPTARIVGVDIDRRMLNLAGANRALAPVTASSSFLPFRDGSVNLVVSTASLKDWREWRKGLFEIARIVAPGGHALVYDFITTGDGSSPGGFARRYGLVSEILRRMMGRFAPFSRADIIELAESLRGTVDVTLQEEPDLGVMGIRFRKPRRSGLRTEEEGRMAPK